MDNLNILTRTSNRPLGFNKCFNSIKNQTYPHITHLVSYDTEKDLEYLKKYNVKKIKVNKRNDKLPPLNNDKRFWYTPYNLYCNDLLSHVGEGWILFVDDDDFLSNSKVIENLMFELNNKNTLYIVKMRNALNEIIPRLFKKQKIRRGNIGTSCIVFHSKFKNIKWDSFKCADFRFIQKLLNTIENCKWIDLEVVTLGNTGNLGKREDIK